MEKTNEKLNIKISFKMKDIVILFEIVYLLFISFMMTMFIMHCMGLPYPNINIKVIATTMNVAIAFIGMAEGARGITKSATTEVGEYSEVPPYKISYLIKLLIFFILITVLSILLTVYCNMYCKTDNIPYFATSELIECIMSNFLSYLFCRYGTKTMENIDLSSIPFFKKK